jgi:archaellum component FlaC
LGCSQVKRDEVRELISETRLKAKEAKDIIEQVQQELIAFRPQAEGLDNNIQKVKILDDKIQKLDKISTNLDITSQKYSQPLGSSVDSLQSQLKELAIQVDKLNSIVTVSVQKPGGESAQAAQQRKAAIQSVISATQKAEQSLAEKRKRTTVFFQFAGGKRPQAEALSDALKKADYIVPGEEREGGAAGKHQVRYFYTQDRVAAENLAQDATRALRNLGYSISQVPNIEAKPFVSYSGKKPSQGTVELWLEIPSR